MLKQIDNLNRHVAQAKAVISIIQIACDSEHSTLDTDTINDALWAVMDNLREIDKAVGEASDLLGVAQFKESTE